MKKRFKLLAVFFTLILVIASFTGCKKDKDEKETNATTGSEDDKGGDKDAKDTVDEIYFLNFKPEIAEVYSKIATDYEAETGVKVKVVTAASGTYEQTLTSEIAKSAPPTIFQINGPIGYQAWKDYCLDIKDTDLYGYLSDPSLAVSSDGGVYGVPYVVEGYGIIYNNDIMDKYFALADRDTDVASMADVKNFATLKAVVEDMQARKADLDIDGVFASTSMGPGEQWRWQTHLANMPLYYEFNEGDGDPVMKGLDAAEIEFKYGENFKNMFDLYINNSSAEKGLLGSKTTDDAMADFALGKAAMVQNGNWAWGQISGVEGNTVSEDDIKYLPIYTGVDGEENQGLCIGTENYFAINSKVDEATQEASVDFLEWLFSSETGKAYVVGDLGFIAPFNTFEDDEKPADPLAKEVLAWMEKDGITSVPWTFATFPSEEFKDDFGASLLEYINGNVEWSEVEDVVKESWKTEYAK